MLRLLIMFCAAPCLIARAGRIVAGSKMRTPSAIVVLREGLAEDIRRRISASAHRGSDLPGKREAAERAQLEPLSVCVA